MTLTLTVALRQTLRQALRDQSRWISPFLGQVKLYSNTPIFFWGISERKCQWNKSYQSAPITLVLGSVYSVLISIFFQKANGIPFCGFAPTYIQGHPMQTVSFEKATMDKKLQFRFSLKVFLKSLFVEFLKMYVKIFFEVWFSFLFEHLQFQLSTAV